MAPRTTLESMVKHYSTRKDDKVTNGFWRDRPVLVTGCTGILGSWLTIALVKRGADVVGLVRDWVPQSQLVRSGTHERVKIVRGDVTDYPLLERLLAEYEIETVFHLAAQTIVPIANRNPLSTFETNIRGTWLLLEAARRVGTVKRMLVASSDKAYGAHEHLPYTETAPLLACHPYDVSKACAEMLAHTYAITYRLPVAVTRCANLYGGGDLNWNRIVPGTMRSVIYGERPVIRSDGSPVRDYLFVQDAIAGYLWLAEALDDPTLTGEAFNFGMDQPKSVLEIVQAIIAISDYPEIEPIILDEAPNEIQAQYLSSAKARQRLGWEPDYTLEQALGQTLTWYKQFLSEIRET
jgi:CDP-glucose 4,6-dehydratase